jgi:hypothetical protein
MNRRTFLAALGAAAATPRYLRAAMSSFNLSVLTDEISQDFGHACEVAAKEFGMGFVDLRERFKLRVACLATPIFKVDWPGAPKSPFSPKRDEFGADFAYKDQDQLLEHAFELAKAFNTDRIRIFDFWRLEDQKPHRAAIDDVVRAAAAKAAKRGVTLVLENEYACNTATGAEAGRLLTAIPDKALAITWDPGNAQFRDESPFPGGYEKIAKGRIGHVHCKDAVKDANGKWVWKAMGTGVIDWAGQFRALKADG